MSELKVRVDGMLRVVCGVSETTTCQDVVIALAHAMGRTGRFTLIEKWRDSERPLLPSDCPIQVLHKWGEYANEVQLLLHQSDKKLTGQPSLHRNDPIPPPVREKDSSIRRVLTFSGAHNLNAVSQKRGTQRGIRQRHHIDNIAEDASGGAYNDVQGQRLKGNVHYESEKQNFHPAFRDKEHLLVNGTKPLPNGLTHRYNTPSPDRMQSQYIPNRPDVRNTKRMEARVNPMQRSSRTTQSVENHGKGAFYPPNRHKEDGDLNLKNMSNHNHYSAEREPVKPGVEESRKSAFQPVVPGHQLQNSLYGTNEAKSESNDFSDQQTDAEEYDLDSNFPNLPSLRDRVMIEEYRMPGDGHHDILQSKPDPELVKLHRLVNMQQERLKMQESQITLIDTELTSLEAKQQEEAEEIEQITLKIKDLDEIAKKYEVEISDLDSISWVDIIEGERQAEKKLNSDIQVLRDNSSSHNTEIEQINQKLPQLQKDIENEKESMKREEEKRKKEEDKINEDMKSLKTNLDLENQKIESDHSELTSLEQELKEFQTKLDQQKEEVTKLEKDLKEVNMQDFKISPGPVRKNKKLESGEAVLKILEGRMSPAIGMNRKMVVSPINNVLSVIKDPDGVWV